MKNRTSHLVFMVIALAVVIVVLSAAPRHGRSQSPSPNSQNKIEQSPKPHTESTVKPTVLVRDSANPAAENSVNASASPFFATAAARNASLRNDLSWTFGGKPRQGWYLYDLLIRKTLNTQSEAGSADFAVALADWQRTKGLSPSGVLEEESFMAMVSHWQNNRLKDRTLAQPDQLLTAPSSDFYDPERVVELRQLERNTYSAYKKMIAAATADPTLNLHTTAGELAPEEKYFKIISAFRSREYQDRLRRESPNAGSAGLAVNSPHFTGRALDIYVGGEPVDTNDVNRAIQVNTPAYRWLVRNAERFGFRPYFYEPWHWEYVR